MKTPLVLIACLVATSPLAAQAPAVVLPDEVRSWLERDQVQRWSAMIREGATLYAEGSCVRCHGADATGGARAPDLTDAEWGQSDGSLEGIRRTIFWGVERDEFVDPGRPFEMNPSGGMQLEWSQVEALAAYVWSLSHDTGLPQGGGSGDPASTQDFEPTPSNTPLR